MKPAADDDGSARRRHHFDPRSRAAREGRHLPTLEELLVNMPFLANDLAVDAPAWAETLLRAFCCCLGVAHVVVSCGSLFDGALAGTARRWNSTEPSLPLRLVLDHRLANPVIVLNELEKAGGSAGNGQLHDVLLGLTEPQTAAAWFDPMIAAPVGLLRVSWPASANRVAALSEPLQDRLRVLRFPAPAAADLPVLAASLLREVVREQGLDPRWVVLLDGEERDALAAAWSGGSLRRLRILVEHVVDLRTAVLQ